MKKTNKRPPALKDSPHLWNFHPYFYTFVTYLPPPFRCLFPVCFSSSAFRCQGQQRRTGPPASWCDGNRTVKREGSGKVGGLGGVGVRCGGSWSLTLAGSGASVQVDPRWWRTASGDASHLMVFGAPRFTRAHTHTYTQIEALTINFQLKYVAPGAFNRGKLPSHRRFPLSVLPTSLRQATIKCRHCQKVCQSAEARPPVTWLVPLTL